MLLNGLPDTCTGCKLSTNKDCGKFIKPTGTGRNKILLVGEASGEHEAREGRPFIEYAPAGSILEKAIRLANYKRNDFIIFNLIACRPPNNILEGASYESEAIAHCRSNLDKVIEEFKPKVIVALGALPTKYLTGFYSSKSRDKKSISYSRGFILNSIYDIPCIPTYHPAYIVRGNTRLIPLLIKDLTTAKLVASDKAHPIADISSEITAKEGLEALTDFYNEVKANPDIWIAYDIETAQSIKGEEDELVEGYGGSGENDVFTGEIQESKSSIEIDGTLDSGEQPNETCNEIRSINDNSLDSREGDILSIQFAISDRWGVYGDWRDKRIRELSQTILNLPNPKVAHNGEKFDLPILNREGITLNGTHHDTLSMRKYLQPDLPAGLQQVAVDYSWGFPWKHYSGSNEVLYGVADVCSLVRIASRLSVELDRFKMWDSYLIYINNFRNNIIVPWENRGIPVDISRLNEYRTYLTSEIEKQNNLIITLVPKDLHTYEEYKSPPKELKEFILTTFAHLFKPWIKVSTNGTTKSIKSKVLISDVFKYLVETEEIELFLSEYPQYKIINNKLCYYSPFNPRSSQQMIKYIKFKGYKIPLTFREKKETTSDKLMKRLEVETNDPVIKLSREIRALEKMRNTYTGREDSNGNIKGGWVPSNDNRLHPSILTQSTWQMSSRGVNVMTMPSRRPDLAERFRRCVRSEPGHTLLSCDFRAFHAKMLGREAQDKDYMRLSDLDIHSYVAGHMVKFSGIETSLSMSDKDLELYLSEIKSKHKDTRNLQAKPTILGIGFGSSYRRVYFENEEAFKSELDAKRLQDLLKHLFPRVFKWQEYILEEADRVKFLQSNWGSRRWFWDIYSWKKNKYNQWYKSKGLDAEAAMAYRPSNHSHGMLRRKLLDMDELGLLEKYQLINVIHDDVLFHCPNTYLDEAIEMVKSIMEYPVTELSDELVCPEGFVCKAEVSIGLDWAKGSMKEVKL